jgi:hypothetical protein
MLMQNMDRQVIMQSLDWVATETLWFCTVLRTYGSAPRAPGALMTIKASGQYCGSRVFVPVISCRAVKSYVMATVG